MASFTRWGRGINKELKETYPGSFLTDPPGTGR